MCGVSDEGGLDSLIAQLCMNRAAFLCKTMSGNPLYQSNRSCPTPARHDLCIGWTCNSLLSYHPYRSVIVCNIIVWMIWDVPQPPKSLIVWHEFRFTRRVCACNFIESILLQIKTKSQSYTEKIPVWRQDLILYRKNSNIQLTARSSYVDQGTDR